MVWSRLLTFPVILVLAERQPAVCSAALTKPCSRMFYWGNHRSAIGLCMG